MSTSEIPLTSAVPSWAVAPFHAFMDHHERWTKLLQLIQEGIAVMPVLPAVASSLSRGRPPAEQQRSEARQKRAEELAAWATVELNEGIPLLHGHAAASFWGALEIAVRTFVSRWLENEPGAMKAEAVQKLRVRLGEYELLEGDERFFYIVDKLEQEISAPLKSGVSRFESLMELVGFGGHVPDDVRKGLFELSHARNVLIHRSGLVDKRFVDACPWLGLTVGSHFPFNSQSTRYYADLTVQYILVLDSRLKEYFSKNAVSGNATQQSVQSAAERV